jgi:hypothetical protein
MLRRARTDCWPPLQAVSATYGNSEPTKLVLHSSLCSCYVLTVAPSQENPDVPDPKALSPEPAPTLDPRSSRSRSKAARRAALIAKARREASIVDLLNVGRPVSEIAAQVGVTERRMRAIIREILAKRMPKAPEEYVATQMSRLHEALLVSYSAMSGRNLQAVDRVVRIVRELDRYVPFAKANPSSPETPRLAAPSNPLRLQAPVVGPEANDAATD